MQRGVTLIELVVYLGILALIGVVAVQLVLSISFNAAEVQSERKIISNGEVAMESLLREIRQAYDLETAASVFGTDPSTLVLKTFTSPLSQDITARSFFLSGESLARQDTGSPAEFITSSDVKVTEFIVWQNANVASTLITVKIRVEAGAGRFKEDKNFYGSAVLRAKY